MRDILVKRAGMGKRSQHEVVAEHWRFGALYLGDSVSSTYDSIVIVRSKSSGSFVSPSRLSAPLSLIGRHRILQRASSDGAFVFEALGTQDPQLADFARRDSAGLLKHGRGVGC